MPSTRKSSRVLRNTKGRFLSKPPRNASGRFTFRTKTARKASRKATRKATRRRY